MSACVGTRDLSLTHVDMSVSLKFQRRCLIEGISQP